MSLRFFHIFFIIASSSLALFGGVWTLMQHKPVAYAAALFACSACLDLYLVWFIKKSKGVSS
jgi:hypothetical protein